jgi:predicted methyltransferase
MARSLRRRARLGSTIATILVAGVVLALTLPAVAQDTEPSVRPGVNDRFLNPDLDATAQANGFESEGREAFVRRHDVISALQFEPGMVVADVGAGSGFYVELMAEAVGSSGRVYAVEIAPAWIGFLREKVQEEGLSHVSVVEGTESSVELPPASVDLIFSSDTYHHFEYPQTTLASIYRALKPGGRWVVLDYDRIPGVTPPGRMEHLRVGQTEALEEIQEAGFTLDELVDLDLVENYMAVFLRP